MARHKSTYYLADDIRTATKVAAAVTHKSESDVVEEALRVYLLSDDAKRARDSVRALMDRIARRVEGEPSLRLTDQQALKLANEAKHSRHQ